jgi:hypothetical protein
MNSKPSSICEDCWRANEARASTFHGDDLCPVYCTHLHGLAFMYVHKGQVTGFRDRGTMTHEEAVAEVEATRRVVAKVFPYDGPTLQ